MSFWKKLFGGSGEARGKDEPAAEAIEHNGFTIVAAPFVEGGQYQTCGVISKEIDGELKQHKFIRADRFASKEDAIDVTQRKARQIIDEQGERIFQ